MARNALLKVVVALGMAMLLCLPLAAQQGGGGNSTQPTNQDQIDNDSGRITAAATNALVSSGTRAVADHVPNNPCNYFIQDALRPFLVETSPGQTALDHLDSYQQIDYMSQHWQTVSQSDAIALRNQGFPVVVGYSDHVMLITGGMGQGDNRNSPLTIGGSISSRQATDYYHGPVRDSDGNPVKKLDSHGNPIMRNGRVQYQYPPLVDADGNPVREGTSDGTRTVRECWNTADRNLVKYYVPYKEDLKDESMRSRRASRPTDASNSDSSPSGNDDRATLVYDEDAQKNVGPQIDQLVSSLSDLWNGGPSDYTIATPYVPAQPIFLLPPVQIADPFPGPFPYLVGQPDPVPPTPQRSVALPTDNSVPSVVTTLNPGTTGSSSGTSSIGYDDSAQKSTADSTRLVMNEGTPKGGGGATPSTSTPTKGSMYGYRQPDGSTRWADGTVTNGSTTTAGNPPALANGTSNSTSSGIGPLAGTPTGSTSNPNATPSNGPMVTSGTPSNGSIPTGPGLTGSRPGMTVASASDLSRPLPGAPPRGPARTASPGGGVARGPSPSAGRVAGGNSRASGTVARSAESTVRGVVGQTGTVPVRPSVASNSGTSRSVLDPVGGGSPRQSFASTFGGGGTAGRAQHATYGGPGAVGGGAARPTRISYQPPVGGQQTPLQPAHVGGVYLRGAGEALDGFANLQGLALDEQGRLVLLADGRSPIALPPLRIDDVVTIFRCVYDLGQSPSVSIDPDPNKPDADFHTLRHGPGTDGTYVGWVLFEADRLMKVYGLGEDNLTRQKWSSVIADYRSHPQLDHAYRDADGAKQHWQRQWIVPASVHRRPSNDRQLTIFDVPLKVNTVTEIIAEGKFVAAPPERRSRSGDAFAAWFTAHYDDIAGECLSRPPADSGVAGPVHVFAELRRIALISAIAESLRDRGVPMPQWMREYAVRTCTMPATTPAIKAEFEVREGSTIFTYSSRGGVTLSPSDDIVQTTPGDPRVEALVPVIRRSVSAAPSFQPVTLQGQDRSYQAVALPGDRTQDLAANVLAATDLDVAVEGGGSIRLTRHFNSFFDPKDILGRSWTLDLPRLEKHARPTKRVGDTTWSTRVYELTSPLNSCYALLKDVRDVAELGIKAYVPDEPGPILALTGAQVDELIGVPSERLVFRDGRRWHFDEHLELVAMEEAPLLLVYHRDQAHRIGRIDGWFGKRLGAWIDLEYDPRGRLAAARASDGTYVNYTFNDAGFLTVVQGPDGASGYEYNEGLVTAVLEDGVVRRRFEYSRRGQLLKERRDDGQEIAYDVRAGAEGVTVTAAARGPEGAAEAAVVRYDSALNPISQTLPGGAEVRRRSFHGVEEATVSLGDGQDYVLTSQADGKTDRLFLPEGGSFRVDRDGAGRTAAVFEGDRPIVRRDWRRDGLLETATYETVALQPRYKDNVLSGLLISAADPQDRTHWLELGYDELGRAMTLSDSVGSMLAIEYDERGRPAKVSGNDGTIEVHRDDRGRATTIASSSGIRQENLYGPDGRLKTARIAKGADQAVVDLQEGRPARYIQFDGGETRISYHESGEHQGRIKEVRAANDLVLKYEYDGSNRLVAVNCGGVYKLEYRYDEDGRLVEVSEAPIEG
jgi:YD repeat-containing protein